MDEFTRIITLFKKSYTGTLSEDEARELEAALENERLRKVHDELLRHDLLREGVEMEALFPWRRALTDFQRRVGWRRRRLIPVAAGVAMAMGLAGALYAAMGWVWENREAVETEVIAPGSGRAMIRLGNGEVLALSNGAVQVEEAGGVQVAYEAGRIAYSGGKGETAVENELMVPPGGECCIAFEDGTVAWVNSDSRVVYPVRFAGGERAIAVEGEVYLEVFPSTRPFIVRTRLGDVAATGTSFGVRVYGADELSATLVSGAIHYTGFDREEVLTPGERVVVTSTGAVTRELVDVREYTGWKDGLFIFHRKSLESIMEDLGRWYECTVSYDDERLRELPFSGHLKRYDHIQSFLELLRETGEVEYTVRGRHVTFYSTE